MTIRNDFPDFGQAPTFLTHNPTDMVGGGSDVITTYDCSSYQYGVLYVSEGATANLDATLAFDWLGAVGEEGNIVSTTNFARMAGGTIVIPFQALTPTLQLRSVDASAGPYSIKVGCTLYTSPPYQHGYPGGIMAINTSTTIVMGDSQLFVPDGCGPGAHVMSVGTTSTDWDMNFELYPDRLQVIVLPLVQAASGSATNIQMVLPATQWLLSITNNDADADFVVVAARTPNPQ